MQFTVIVPTHNPDAGRLRRTLLGLKAQTLPAADWELLLVNNASTAFPPAEFFSFLSLANLTILEEPELGLTAARRRGLTAARGECAILVDDDNVLAPGYLHSALALLQANPRIGAAGGKSLPEFEVAGPAWAAEFFPLLALRDLGDRSLITDNLRPAGASQNVYPASAPIGAGMVLRQAAWEPWLAATAIHGGLSDRRGTALTSGGDNVIVLEVLKAGWSVGYFPELSLTHLIPAGRLQPDYLARLNRGIQQSWMQVLSLYDANPWPPLSAFGARSRMVKAWFSHRAWRSPAARIRWQGACGHFSGRVR